MLPASKPKISKSGLITNRTNGSRTRVFTRSNNGFKMLRTAPSKPFEPADKSTSSPLIFPPTLFCFGEKPSPVLCKSTPSNITGLGAPPSLTTSISSLNGTLMGTRTGTIETERSAGTSLPSLSNFAVRIDATLVLQSTPRSTLLSLAPWAHFAEAKAPCPFPASTTKGREILAKAPNNGSSKRLTLRKSFIFDERKLVSQSSIFCGLPSVVSNASPTTTFGASVTHKETSTLANPLRTIPSSRGSVNVPSSTFIAILIKRS